MSTGAALGVVVAAALVAFALRASVIVALSSVAIPAWLERALSFIGPAVLASITVNFAFGGPGGPQLGLAEVLALAAALAVTVWRRSAVLALIVAMPVLWGVSAL